MDNRIYLFLRFFVTLIIILGTTFIDMDLLNFIPIALILIFIINTQLRYYLFRDKLVPVFISILMDFIIGYILHSHYTTILLPFFILGIIDSFFLMDSFIKYILSLIGLVFLFYSGLELPLDQLFTYVIAYIVIGLISSLISDIEHRQIKTENLYHKLKKSEDELMKTNKELEAYAESIKELTLLKERNRISREIHDSVGHSLSTIIIQLGAIEKIAKTDGESASLMAKNLREFAKNGLEEIRKALKELKPKEFKEYETLLAIETLIKDFSNLTNIDVKLGFSKTKWQVDEETSLVIYRAIQEFLSNSSRHGKATKINIFIHYDNDVLILTMQDNGIGVDNIIPGMDLTSLTERVNELGGKVNYESGMGKGFLLRIVL